VVKALAQLYVVKEAQAKAAVRRDALGASDDSDDDASFAPIASKGQVQVKLTNTNKAGAAPATKVRPLQLQVHSMNTHH